MAQTELALPSGRLQRCALAVLLLFLNLPAYPINEICKAMDSIPESDSMARIFAAMDVFDNYTGDLACFDIYDDPHGMSGWD
ncbi:hypothetical protein AXG93_1263s1020 [Marchantia polymorpha subsp. ruderalis]|uniref:Uncharacterized protein n=1 Tax=Marchantia polymorpha subsp. ruderalis TaxID=1480154 RepID=A0A176VNA6_MARPO|nr:hypothetical protein AXG93_1263s1020 [Marchantia polymorpha subsp. ruderalis]